MKKKQMITGKAVSASSATWSDIKWRKVELNVYRLQMRIAKAAREQRPNKVKALQWLLTHSLEAKLLAVKRVTSSQGAKTSGVDGKLYQKDTEKMQLALSLKQRGYKAQPLKRVYIPKRNGKMRALGIPTIFDRTCQALYLMALEPIAEIQADPNSYGFRPYRSTADAVERCFKVLCNKKSVRCILECDIKACFDKISHQWLLQNIPIEKRILKQWLKAGFMEKQTIFPTTEGTPQGGVISPLLANMVLDGLEATIQRAKGKGSHKIHMVRYADDFVVMGATKELLESRIKPAIAEFLAERGLELSLEKTQITSIDQGFDFLGFNIRKYQDKLLIKPAKESILSFLARIRQIIKSHPTIKADELIGMLNPKIRGWAYYYRHVVAKRTFGYVDDCIYRCLSNWTARRHPNKNFEWIGKKYFHRRGNHNWIFFGIQEKTDGSKVVKDLEKASYIPIKRYIKIRSEAIPYDPAYVKYLANRKQDRNNKLYHYWKISTLNLFGEAQWIDLKFSARSF